MPLIWRDAIHVHTVYTHIPCIRMYIYIQRTRNDDWRIGPYPPTAVQHKRRARARGRGRERERERKKKVGYIKYEIRKLHVSDNTGKLFVRCARKITDRSEAKFSKIEKPTPLVNRHGAPLCNGVVTLCFIRRADPTAVRVYTLL